MKLGVALTLVYKDEEDDEYPTPSAISIILLNFLLAITFPFEMISWEKAVRYLISPHLGELCELNPNSQPLLMT